MIANPFTVYDQTIPEAQEIMMQNRVKRLPVLKGKLVGVVSKEDIERYSPSKATALSMERLLIFFQERK